MLQISYQTFMLLFLHFATFSQADDQTQVESTATTTTSLSPAEQAALSDFPLISAIVSNLGESTGYLFQDYQSYATMASETISNDIYNYFEMIQEMTDYQELKSEMVISFPFTEFHDFITMYPWYSTLLSEAGMSTFYFPENFVATATESNSHSVASSTTTESSDGTSRTVSQTVISPSSTTSLISLTTSSSTSSTGSVTSSVSKSNSMSSTSITKSKSSNDGFKTQSISIFTALFLCLFGFII